MHADELLIDAYETDLYRANLTIAELQREATWHRDVAKTAVRVIRTLTLTVDRLRDQHQNDQDTIQELRQELSELYATVPMPMPVSSLTITDDDSLRY